MDNLIFVDGTNYIELIKSINAEMILLKDAVDKENRPTKFFCMRHDMDALTHFKYSIKFAELEYKMGYKSTYAVRYTTKLCDFFTDSVINRCKALTGLGHDLNLHLNIIKLYMDTGESIKNIIEKPLNFLRNNGLEIKGVSAHGDPENYIYGFNYEFWKEFDPKKNEGMEKLLFDKVSLKDFDLSYEAYFLDYDVYLTDSMGKWTGILLRELDTVPYENSMIYSDNIGINVIDDFNNNKETFLQISIHPNPDTWEDKKL